jgi:hypothetical protein
MTEVHILVCSLASNFFREFTTVKGYSIISGIIKDAGGNVVTSALVTLSNNMTATTDANGSFSFSGVSA